LRQHPHDAPGVDLAFPENIPLDDTADQGAQRLFQVFLVMAIEVEVMHHLRDFDLMHQLLIEVGTRFFGHDVPGLPLRQSDAVADVCRPRVLDDLLNLPHSSPPPI
jgi:hypothetical protein